MYKTLGKKFNGVAQATRIFLVGLKDFAKDAKIYFGVRAKVLFKSDKLKKLSRKELEIYYHWPSEFSRLFPTLAISALPFANYVMIPVAFCYPKHLLSSHFWTSEQKSLFLSQDLQRKQKYYVSVKQHLEAHVCFIAEASQRDAFDKLLRKIDLRAPITPEEVLQVRDSFTFRPFCLAATGPKHANTLCRMHGMGVSIFRTRARLWKTAQMIQYLDLAIQREGISDMKLEDLRTACYLRGYNSTNRSGDDMNQFMNQWVTVTTSLTPGAYSLILHLPIFLCYHSSDDLKYSDLLAQSVCFTLSCHSVAESQRSLFSANLWHLNVTDFLGRVPISNREVSMATVEQCIRLCSIIDVHDRYATKPMALVALILTT